MNYSLAQIETLTGVSGHKLRIWERRYRFLKPERSSTNIRYYTDDQLKMLLNISVMIRNGYRLAKIDKMSHEDIIDIVTELLSDENLSNEDEHTRLVQSMMEFDESLFHKIFNTHVLRKGLLSTITELIYPFMSQIGVMWGTSKVVPAQEHFISNIVRQKIIAAIESIPQPKTDAKRVVMFLREGEHHEIGLLLAQFIARDMGWKVYYLGQNVPEENITSVIKTTSPDVLVSMLITPISPKEKDSLSEFFKKHHQKFLISGSNNNLEQLKSFKNIVVIRHPQDFINYIK